MRRLLPNARVWLFGSRALNKALRRSDFDLAVELDPGISESVLWEFEAAVQADPEIIYSVDVVNLRSAPEVLCEKIQREGILWKD